MRPSVPARLAAIASLALAAPAAMAQPATRPLPRAFDAYLQHDITPGLCHVVSPAEAQCIIPEMTAGPYAIEVAGTSTAQGPGATQTLKIVVGAVPCATGQNTGTWTQGARTFRLGCVVTLLTDQSLIARVIYEDAHATKDPAGPLISVRRLPWQGVLNVTPYVPKQ
ncbi:hypothetical protein ACO2Q3_24800 [Caulobacter sp. KR2-114]|uniref:hypothetical protein n=1 Tax=Caulobacter sp. KR2-114 TaxID=3400912 RepID=UPI003C0C7E2B